MPTSRTALRVAGSLLVCVAWIAAACGQDDTQRRTELGERQRLVERNMAELESRFVRVAEALQAKEPERAQRLIATLNQAKEKLISRRMTEVTRLLDANQLDEAERALRLVVDDLEELVRVLLNDQRDSMTRRQEVEALERWKSEIARLRREQSQQAEEAGKLARKDETLQDLDALIQQVEAIAQQQQSLIDQTRNQSSAGAAALDKLADRQFEIRQQTEDVARRLTPASTPSAAGQSPPPAPGEAAPAGEQPAAGGNAAPPSGEDRPAEPDNPSATPPAPGVAPLQAAMRQQRASEERLIEGRPAEAERAEQQALQALREGLEQLQRERRRIATLPEDAFEKMAREQRRTQGQTSDLGREMSQAKKPSSDDSSDSAPTPGKQPGQQSVDEAAESMGQAAGGLEQNDMQRAERQEREAVKKLDEALREIEERLAQLREETRQEKLARLEARFSEMLARQRTATGQTIEMNDKRVSLQQLDRRQAFKLVRVSSEESEIAELGQQAYDLLLEDGTSAVFPECVQDVRDLLGRVSELLAGERTDQLTQLLQYEVEAALEDLLEALQQAQNENEGGGGGGGGGGKQPLLRKSAELKMLRAAQMRVNRLTRQFELIRGEGPLDVQLEQEIQQIAERQADIAEYTDQVKEKN